MATTAQTVSQTAQPLSWFTRVAYGLGDTSCNVVWGAMGILTFFYTDYAGVSPAIVGSVMLLPRCSRNIFVSFMIDDVFNKFSCYIELFSQCTRSKFWMSPNMNSTNINNLFRSKF